MSHLTGREVFEKIKQEIIENHKDLDLKKIEEAYILASESHKGQLRKSGEEYIVHPLEVAEILLSLKMDTDTIIAGILHDVVEDTYITLSDIEYSFGKEVSNLIDGVTKLRNLPKSEGKQIENIRKMVVAMSEDVRVVLIKLADRLHNMRTLKFQSPEKQIEKAKETMDVFAPIAHRIGMGKIKSELEDLSFYFLNPTSYKEIKELINTKKEEREKYIERVKEIIETELKKANINAKVKGRPKHLYSIYKKMYEKNKNFSDLMDLIALRIITEKDVDCYSALGIVHAIFEPLNGRVKDYVAVPKENGYQSLHTIVKGLENKIFEIQIRTQKMHEIAEDGVAAHWKYKEKKTKDKNEKYYSSLKKIIESNIEKEDKNENFAKEITAGILKKTIFVFTPKGDVIELENGSTVLDFAFQVHTQIGYRTIGAKVNGKIVTLDYKVENGDKIEILISKTAKGPGNDWINMVNNPSSKSKIKKWFKDLEFESKAKEGEELLIAEFNKIGLKFKDYEDNEKTLLYMKKYNLNNIEQLFYKFAVNELSIETFMSKFEKKEEINVEEYIEEETQRSNKIKQKNSTAIKVNGSDNIEFKIAKCCLPLPGDSISALITSSHILTVHKKECKNFKKFLENSPQREVFVYWDEKELKNSKSKYEVEFTIVSFERTGLLLDIMRILSEYRIDLTQINSKSKKDSKEIVHINLRVLVKNKEELEKLIKHLLSLKDIIDIIRNIS